MRVRVECEGMRGGGKGGNATHLPASTGMIGAWLVNLPYTLPMTPTTKAVTAVAALSGNTLKREKAQERRNAVAAHNPIIGH